MAECGNPQASYCGAAPGTNAHSNPNAVAMLGHDMGTRAGQTGRRIYGRYNRPDGARASGASALRSPPFTSLLPVLMAQSVSAVVRPWQAADKGLWRVPNSVK